MNTFTETCPSLEDLAAFLDGGLSGDERARIVAHLADCPACYEVFTEAARFKISEEEEEEEEPAPSGEIEANPPAKVIPFPKRPIVRLISSIAAVLAMVAVAVPLYQQHYAMPNLTSQELVSVGATGKATQDGFWSQWTNRGDTQDVSMMSEPHEFLLGAHLVDLRLGLLREDKQAADDALARIYGHLTELGTRTARAASFYASAREQLWNGHLPQNFLQQVDQTEASLRSEEYPYLDFGKWAEAGRLSALNQDPDFFQSPKSRKFLENFLHHELKDLEAEAPEVATDLEGIQETLASAAPSSLPYEDLQARFEKILTFYQNQAEQGLGPVGLSPAP